MSRALVLAAAAGLVLLTACNGDPAAPAPDVSATTPAGPVAPPATQPQPPVTAPPAQPPAKQPPATAKPAPTAAPVVPAVKFPTARAALDYLLEAWKKNDKTLALNAAGPNTVNKLFQRPWSALVTIESCDKGADAGAPNYAYRCYYRYEGGSRSYYINPYGQGSWRVENITDFAD